VWGTEVCPSGYRLFASTRHCVKRASLRAKLGLASLTLAPGTSISIEQQMPLEKGDRVRSFRSL
jgi:hypothetical protein